MSDPGFERLLVATDGFGFRAAAEEAIKITVFVRARYIPTKKK
jgi:hypothetical protein